jgi:hypothetical protein
MNLFRFLQPAASAPMARERLQILLEYERTVGSQIDLFAVDEVPPRRRQSEPIKNLISA